MSTNALPTNALPANEVAANSNVAFQTVREPAWRQGFVNLLRHENALWWRSRRWWINLLIWTAVVNGVLLAMLSVGENPANPLTPEEMLVETRTVYAVMAGLFGTIGTIIALQGAIIDEKKSGTAAWILSKPVSRGAFLAAKLVANGIALLILVLVAQGVIAYVQFAGASGSAPPVGPFALGVALLGLNLLFYLTLTLMLGTLFNDRGAVIGIAIGVLFGGMFLVGMVGQAAYLLPWLILPSGNTPGLAVEAMSGQPLSTAMPIVATVVWSVIFTGVALWRFRREEF